MRETVPTTARGQLSLPLVEAVIGAMLVLGVAAAFTLGVPGPGRDRAQLERYADDTLDGLAATPVDDRDAPGSLLVTVARSDTVDGRYGTAARERTAALLPGGTWFQLRTPAGRIGAPVPPDATVGRATATTRFGAVRVVVWYG